MRISVIVMGVLILGFMVIGYYTTVSDMASEQGGYNVDIDDSYSASFDKTEEMANNISAAYDSIKAKSANTGAAYLTLIPELWVIVKNTVSLPFSIIGGVIESIVEYVGLPAWVTTFFIAVITIIFIFGLIALIFRYRYT